MIVTKRCPKCERTLPMECFYRNANRRDGHCFYCKECTQKAGRKSYRLNRDRILAHDKQRNQNPDRMARRDQSSRESKQKYPEKHRARSAVYYALKCGNLARLPCQFCGATDSEAHHKDYGKPLEVIWVCRRCHYEKFHNSEVQP